MDGVIKNEQKKEGNACLILIYLGGVFYCGSSTKEPKTPKNMHGEDLFMHACVPHLQSVATQKTSALLAVTGPLYLGSCGSNSHRLTVRDTMMGPTRHQSEPSTHMGFPELRKSPWVCTHLNGLNCWIGGQFFSLI